MDKDVKLNKEDVDAVAGGGIGYDADWLADAPDPMYPACIYVYIRNDANTETIRAYIRQVFYDHNCEYETPAGWLYKLDGPDGTRYLRFEREILGRA